MHRSEDWQKPIDMADNYLERKFEALRERREKEEKARKLLWRKRLDAYRKSLEEKKQQ